MYDVIMSPLIDGRMCVTLFTATMKSTTPFYAPPTTTPSEGMRNNSTLFLITLIPVAFKKWAKII